MIAETVGGAFVNSPWVESSMNRHDAFFLVVVLIAAAAILVAAPMVVSFAIRSGADALGRIAAEHPP